MLPCHQSIKINSQSFPVLPWVPCLRPFLELHCLPADQLDQECQVHQSDREFQEDRVFRVDQVDPVVIYNNYK